MKGFWTPFRPPADILDDMMNQPVAIHPRRTAVFHVACRRRPAAPSGELQSVAQRAGGTVPQLPGVRGVGSAAGKERSGGGGREVRGGRTRSEEDCSIRGCGGEGGEWWREEGKDVKGF